MSSYQKECIHQLRLSQIYRPWLVGVAMTLAMSIGFVTGAHSWTRGNHAGRWSKGQTLKVCVDTPPGDAANQSKFQEAVSEAMAEWNEAQAEFGGLTLERATEDCNIRIHWEANRATWGSTAPGGPPVSVTIESNDGLNSRGVTRVLKHELGHAEGLGHSAASELMKADAYSSTPGVAPSAEDLNSPNPFTNPTADDKAGKRELYGTAEDLAKPKAESRTVQDQETGRWQYEYVLSSEKGEGLSSPVVSLAIELPDHVTDETWRTEKLPEGWTASCLSGRAQEGAGRKQLDSEEAQPPSLLWFSVEDPELGVYPGGTVTFHISSELAPARARGFASSVSHDTAEFELDVPSKTSEQPPPQTPCGHCGSGGTGIEVALVLSLGALAGFVVRRRRS
jgi:hypothetical protein